MNYESFIKAKHKAHKHASVKLKGELNSALFDFQKAIVKWALKKGKAAIFADCGLGKTIMQLEWARHIDGKVLILAPLAVTEQTAREGEKFGINVTVCENSDDVQDGINITNYEKLHNFDATVFKGVILDESSILKNYTGKFRNLIIESFANTKYKLACTATPAPNDFMELGNHCEFLDVKSRTEMLAEYFVHDGKETQKWRLKGHAIKVFWQWVNSWATVCNKPSDLGFSDDDFQIPELHIKDVIVQADYQVEGMLFPLVASTLSERQTARKKTVAARADKVAELIAEKPDESWIIWCNLNNEADACVKAIDGAVEIRGSHSNDYKKKHMLGFSSGEVKILVTKPSIAGFGMNWQHCNNVVFCGLSDSYEQFYQAVRRCWRFGQTKDVTAYVVTSDVEGAVVQNIKRKEEDSRHMSDSMINLKDFNEDAAHAN